MLPELKVGEGLVLKAVGLLLALILWVTILGFKREELKIPIRLEPLLPPGRIITNKVPANILFTFTGPRLALKDLQRKIQPIRPDLRRTRDTTIGFSITEDLLGELPSGVRIAGFYPPNVLLRLEELVEMSLPVRPTLVGAVPAGYRVLSVVAIPREVRVLGPKSQLETQGSLPTAPIELENLTGSVTKDVEVEIDSESGVQFTRERVVQVVIAIKPVRARSYE